MAHRFFPELKINISNVVELRVTGESYYSIASVTVGTDDNAVVSAEEAIEIPPIIPIDLNTPLITDINTIPEFDDTSKRKHAGDEKNNDRRELFRRIGQQEFEDVVFTPKRKQKKSRNKTANESEHTLPSPSTDHLSSSLSADDANANKATTTHSSLLSLSMDDNCILKSDRDLETIQRDVEDKEKLLANILDLDSILSKYMTSSRMDNHSDSNISSRMDTITYINCNVHSNDTVNEEQDANEEKEYAEQSDHTETESGEEDVSYRTELKRLEDLGECRKTLLQNQLDDTPPTGNSFVDTRQASPMDRHELEVQFNGN